MHIIVEKDDLAALEEILLWLNARASKGAMLHIIFYGGVGAQVSSFF
jgi:hypothetical protein